MDERYKRAKQIFLAACELTGTAQIELLDRECGDDAELRAEVESLLAHHGDAPTATVDVSVTEAGIVGSHPHRIGRYRIVRELGRGGMGVVYLGVRDDDRFKQHVAIKVLKRGMDTAEILRRFELERQLLAALNHPGIGRLFDGGETDEGLPYFAMEYVEGQPIDDYCDTHRLRIAERLVMFQKVCAAVHYAHQNLVVHRDLKPSNIIVNREGEPKLLDFGIAKVINPGISLIAGDPTAPEVRIMTPEYASPEQARGDPISTASDIYSLGVLLYELVTGHRPYRLSSRVKEEILRVICEVDPDKPSTAVSKVEEIVTDENDPTTGTTTITPEFVSRVREGHPDRLRRRLAGDIDNIVLMAMRKEPQRRYRSAEQFSEDIGRHLDGLPVIARRDTAVYRMSKFVRRHRVGVGAAAAILIAVTLGTVGTTMGYFAQKEQRRRAESMLTQVVGMAHAFIFDFHDKVAPLDGSLPARQLLVTEARDYLESISAEAGDNLDVQRVLADSYDKLGSIEGGIRNPATGTVEDALENYRIGLAMREQLAAEFPDDLQLQKAISLSHMHMGDIYGRSGDMDSAMRHYTTALDIAEVLAASGPEYKRTLTFQLINVGKAQFRSGQRADARASYERALVIRRELVGGDPTNVTLQRDLTVALIRVAAIRAESGEDEQALVDFTEAADIRRRISERNPDSGRFRRDYGVALYFLADFLITRGRMDEAAEPIATYQAIARQRVRDNPNDLRSKLDLAAALESAGVIRMASGDLGGASADFTEFAGLMVELADADPAETQYQRRLAASHRRLADVSLARGDTIAAALGYERAITIFTSLVTADPDDVYMQIHRAEALHAYGDVLREADSVVESQERLGEAAGAYRVILERQPDHAEARRGLVKTLQSVARAMEARGYTESAATYAQQALAELTRLDDGPSVDELRASIEEDLRRYRQ